MNYQISLKPPSRWSNVWKESLIKGTKLLGPWHHQNTKLYFHRKGTMPHVSFRGSMLKHNPRARNCSKKILRENWRAVPAGGVLLLKSIPSNKHPLSVAECRTEPLEDCDDAACVARKPTWMCVVFFGAMDPRKKIQVASVVTWSQSPTPTFDRKRRLQMFYIFFEICLVWIYPPWN